MSKIAPILDAISGNFISFVVRLAQSFSGSYGLFAAIGALAASALQEIRATLKDGPMRTFSESTDAALQQVKIAE